MKKRAQSVRLRTGIRNLDELLHGGIPKGSATIVGGTPGAGKTTLVQQICFHNASPDAPVLFFNTLSEPTAKTLRHISQFDFFDRTKIDNGVHFTDLGVILRADGLDEVSRIIMERLKKVRPAIVVIDSFKAFDDLTASREELRKFAYETGVNLMAWNATAFLIGEYGPSDVETNPLFSIVDGLITVTQRELSGEQQRCIQVVKMRGTDHSRDEHPFAITAKGVEVFAPRLTIQREDRGAGGPRSRTGISRLDDLLGEGIPRGSSVLVSGVAGTGKTVLLLEFLYRGARAGEKGIMFSFEETEERLLASAKGLGWDIVREIERGMLEIVFVPQPSIMVEAHLLMMGERIEKLGAQRIAVDSVSVFMHKIVDVQVAREKVFHIASLVQNAQAVALLATDIPYGSDKISRFGVEETVVDGVIVLTSTPEGLERHRYLEIYKLRNTSHLKGRHEMEIGEGGISIYPRYNSSEFIAPEQATRRRLGSGTPNLDRLLGGGLFEGSVSFVAGSAGIGKSTLGLQFLLEGARKEEVGLFVALEESSVQLRATAETMGLPLERAIDAGLIDIITFSRAQIRPNQMLSALTDRIRSMKVRRLVFDGASHVTSGTTKGTRDLRFLLDSLTRRFKALGVTAVVTFETATLEGRQTVTGRAVSPIADNLIMLRYREQGRQLVPTLTVIKTRGSAHDFGTHEIAFGEGGLRIQRATGEEKAKPRRLRRPR